LFTHIRGHKEFGIIGLKPTEMETTITILSENTSKRKYADYTDKSIVITQFIDGYKSVVILNKNELEELERVVGAKFKA